MNITVLSLVIGVLCAGISFVLFYSYRRSAGISLAVISLISIALGAFIGISQIRENSNILSENQPIDNITNNVTDQSGKIEPLIGPFAKIEVDRPAKDVLKQYAQAILEFAATSPTPTISGTISAADLEWSIKNSPRRISEEYSILITGLPTKIAPRVTLSIISEAEKSSLLATLCLYKTGAATEGPCVYSSDFEEEIVSQLTDAPVKSVEPKSTPEKGTSLSNPSTMSNNTESK